jgi:hypothetical protein
VHFPGPVFSADTIVPSIVAVSVSGIIDNHDPKVILEIDAENAPAGGVPRRHQPTGRQSLDLPLGVWHSVCLVGA